MRVSSPFLRPAAAARIMALALAAAPLPAVSRAQSEDGGRSNGPTSTASASRSAIRPTVPRDTATAVALVIDSGATGAVRETSVRAVRYRTAADSIASIVTRAAADTAPGLRVIVSLHDRVLRVLRDGDTLRVAQVAVASDTTLEFEGRSWTFSTPRGRRAVLGKKQDPVWTPPDWHYAEVARNRGLKLAALSMRRPTVLADGSKLVIRDGRVGLVSPGAEFAPLPTTDEIIFDGTLFVPPFGTENRRIPGELGRHLLDMGEGYLLHGTPYEDSIGSAATHGCVRLRAEDVQWLYENVPVGTHVYIY